MREKKKKAEKKKNVGATQVAATENAETDAEDAGGANAEDMAEVAEEKKIDTNNGSESRREGLGLYG